MGQFFTPAPIAAFMAQMFTHTQGEVCRLLDAGAGIGSLSAAFLERCVADGFSYRRIEADLFEIDEDLHPYLTKLVEEYQAQLGLLAMIRGEDFVKAAAASISGGLFQPPQSKYTHAILNPPYKKIHSNSAHRELLRQAGIETVNLYAAFVALSLALLEHGGQLVAIIPRSFCNGPYYRPFRKFMLKHAAIRRIHLFASRDSAFRDDDVLQENVIIMLERGGAQEEVVVTTSTDDRFNDIATQRHQFDRIVFPSDSDGFIHVPTSPGRSHIELSEAISHSLAELGIQVSTGPVVDFRLKDYLLQMPVAGSVPLVYPVHFDGHSIHWPINDSKKPNAIERSNMTEKWLYPIGCYCLVRRFSSKEERRRIVASVVLPSDFPDTEAIAFENHLNVFHEHRRGLPEALARGLSVFLSTTAVDEYFRRFNGHTQVNANDLRSMKYPSRLKLTALGEWMITNPSPTQEQVDKQLEKLS